MIKYLNLIKLNDMEDYKLSDEILKQRYKVSNLVDGIDSDSNPIYKLAILKSMIDELIDELIKL